MKNLITLIFLSAVLITLGGCGVQSGQIDLAEYVGKKITIAGKIAEIPYQHLIDAPATHPEVNYFDLASGQIVVYSKEDLECKGPATISGVVIKTEGVSKRPGSDERYTEYQIVMDEIKCATAD